MSRKAKVCEWAQCGNPVALLSLSLSRFFCFFAFLLFCFFAHSSLSRSLDDGHNTCPLCFRDEFEDDDWEKVAQNLKCDFNNPDCLSSKLLENKEEQIAYKKSLEDSIEDVQSSLGDWRELKRLKKELDNLSEAINTNTEKLDCLEGEAAAVTSSAKKVESDLSEVERLRGEVLKLRDEATRIIDKRTEADQKKSALQTYAPSSKGKTLRDVEKELMAATSEKDELMKSTQDLNKEMANINRNLQIATTRASAADKTAKDKRLLFDKYGDLDSKRTSLRESIKNCNSVETQLREQEAPLRQETAKMEAAKARLRETASTKEAGLSKEASEFSAQLADVMAHQTKIERFNEGSGELEKLNADIASIESSVAKVEGQIKEIEPEIAAAMSRSGDNARRKKQIVDNIRYREGLAKIKDVEEEASEVEKELAAMESSSTSQDDFDEASSRIEELNNEKNRMEGQFDALAEQSELLQAKLNQPEYKDVEEKHRQTMISFETTRIAVLDLDKYFSAVDRALLRYHSLKIEDINKIIKELWSLTYKGADITNIKIVSDSTKASRSYNYRVVMSKGGTEMDMRGRCSAGQRVLASIVIRLALAETFCINCGVLALDEPTTNLDHENKRGLAIALSQIIANRSSQHNFQLLAITHDEDFCDMMKNELATQGGNFSLPDSYFYVNREEGADGKQYSKISKVSWDEL